jgi:hypothetical protein
MIPAGGVITSPMPVDGVLVVVMGWCDCDCGDVLHSKPVRRGGWHIPEYA